MAKRSNQSEDLTYPSCICCVCCESVASLTCSCTIPRLYLCRGCLPSHLSTPCSHTLDPLPSVHKLPRTLKTESLVFCSICKLVEARNLCICAQPPLSLCINCMERHTNEEPWGKHAYHPAAMREKFAEPGYVAAFKSRQKRVRETYEKLAKILSSMTSAHDSILHYSDSLIESILSYRNQKLTELDTLKQDFESKLSAALREIRMNIYEEVFHSENELAVSIWNQAADELVFPVFEYSGETFVRAIREIVEETLKRNVKTDEEVDVIIPILSGTKFKRFNCSLGIWLPPLPLTAPILFDEGSCFLLTDSGNLFICGRSDPITPAAFIVSGTTGIVTELERMQTPRGWAGCCKYRGCVYVLGGIRSRNLKKSEKFCLETVSWSRLPDMLHSRSGFNPCLSNSCLYIAGGDDCNYMEWLNLQSEVFSRLDLRIPGGKYSVLLARGEDFVLVQEKNYFNVSVREKRIDKVGNEISVAISVSPFPPAITGGEVFVLGERGEIVALDVANMSYRIVDED